MNLSVQWDIKEFASGIRPHGRAEASSGVHRQDGRRLDARPGNRTLFPATMPFFFKFQLKETCFNRNLRVCAGKALFRTFFNTQELFYASNEADTVEKTAYFLVFFTFMADFGARTTAPSHGSRSVMNCF